MQQVNSGVEYRACPCCGEDDFDVLFESNMSGSDFPKAVETVYMLPGRAWGRHVRCQSCQFIYVNPIEQAVRINEAYSQRESTDAPVIRETRLRAAQEQVRLISRREHGSYLLDIGCGEGFFLFNASRAGYDAKGVELSRDAADYARTEFNLDVQAKPFEELRFPENCFDVITMWQVLEHVPYPRAILEEAHRILKPRGLLALSTPNIDGLPARILGRRWWNIRMLHINQFSTKTLGALLDNTGFRHTAAVSYKESISLLMLLVPVLKYLGLYGPLRSLVHPGSILGRGMNRMTIPYPSRLDNCIMVGFK